MVGRQPCKRGLNDVTLRVLVRVTVDQPICTRGGNCSREDPFAFLACPLARFLANTESLDGSRGQRSPDSLSYALLALVATVTASAARARRGIRVRPVMMTMGTTTAMVTVSGSRGRRRTQTKSAQGLLGKGLASSTVRRGAA